MRMMQGCSSITNVLPPLSQSPLQGCMQDWFRPTEPSDLGPARIPHPAVLPFYGPGWRLPLPAGSPAQQQHKAASSSSTGEAQRVFDREAAATARVQRWRQRQQRAACAQAGGACVRPDHPQPLRQALSWFVCVSWGLCVFSCKCAPATNARRCACAPVTAASAHMAEQLFVPVSGHGTHGYKAGRVGQQPCGAAGAAWHSTSAEAPLLNLCSAKETCAGCGGRQACCFSSPQCPAALL